MVVPFKGVRHFLVALRLLWNSFETLLRNFDGLWGSFEEILKRFWGAFEIVSHPFPTILEIYHISRYLLLWHHCQNDATKILRKNFFSFNFSIKIIHFILKTQFNIYLHNFTLFRWFYWHNLSSKYIHYILSWLLAKGSNSVNNVRL